MVSRLRGRPKGSGGNVATLVLSDVQKALKSARRLGRYSIRNEVALLLSVEFGLRAGDLALLRVGDLFDQGGKLRDKSVISRSLSCGNSELLTKKLLEYWHSHLGASPDDAPLLRSQHGGGLTRATVARLPTSAYKSAGIAGASSRSGARTMKLARRAMTASGGR